MTGATHLLGSQNSIAQVKLAYLFNTVIAVAGEPVSNHGIAVDATFALERLQNRGDGLSIWFSKEEAIENVKANDDQYDFDQDELIGDALNLIVAEFPHVSGKMYRLREILTKLQQDSVSNALLNHEGDDE